MRIFISLFFCCCSTMVSAQSYATYTYTTKDGLSTDELLDLAIDTFGCIWLQSGLGITRFDGKRFTHFDNSVILEEGGNIAFLFGDKEGNVWALIHNPQPPKTQAMIFHGIDKQRIITIDSLEHVALNVHAYTGKVYSFGHKNTLKFHDATGTVTASYEIGTPEFLRGEEVDVNIAPAHFSPGWTVTVIKNKGTVWRYYHWENGQYDKIPFDKQVESWHSHMVRLPDKSYFVTDGTRYFRLSPGGKISSFDISRNTQKTPLPAQLLLPAPSFQTVVHYGRFYGQIIEFSRELPQGYSFKFNTAVPIYKWGQMAKGKDGTYWVATRSGLIHLFPYMYEILSGYDKPIPNDLHVASEDKSGNIWFGSYSDGFRYFDGAAIRNPSERYKGLNEFLPGSFRDEEGNMYFSIQKGQFKGIFHLDGHGKPEMYLRDFLSFHFHRSYDGELGISLDQGFAIAHTKKGGQGKPDHPAIYNASNSLRLTKTTTSVKDKYGRWWVGHRSAGLACAESSTGNFTNFLVAEKASPYGFWSSCMDSKGNIWFGTSGGLFLLRNKRDMDIPGLDLSTTLKQIGSSIFTEQTIFALHIVEDRFLLIGYQKGLAILDLERFYATEGKDEIIHVFTDKDGFTGSSVEQNGFYPDAQGRVWIITDEGAFRFDPGLFVWGRGKPNFKILKLIAGTDSLQWNGKEIHLKPEVQDVKILLNTSNDPSLKGDVTFLYRTLPNGSWSKSENESYISLNASIPGRYTVEILAMRDSIFSDAQIISFEIPYIWYQNPITKFLFVSGLLMLVGLAVLVYYRQRAKLAEHKAQLQKERAEAETLKGETERQKSEMARLQVKSIVSQLNPHFTMNALNTLQIISYENPVAVKITGRLADNIRIAFNNTRLAQPYHRLWDEIQMVNNYLCIQKERFEEKLTYRLPSDEELDAHSGNHILLTQILIHCENAVEHGIRNQENGGQVRVLLKDEDEYLHIIVEDEGIGRQKAKEIHSIGTQQGTKMLAELQRIYNANNHLPIRTEYEDGIYQLSGVEPFGTRVHIWMPKKYYFEIN